MPKEGNFDDEKIKKLKKSKSSIKAKLTYFENYIKLASSYDSLSELHKTEMECRLSKFENLYVEFDQLQIKLEELCDPPDEQYADREAFESQYYQLLSRGRHLFATADNDGRDDSVAGSGHRSALVRVYDCEGKAHSARLLLDNGSTTNLITQELCAKLGLSRRASGSPLSLAVLEFNRDLTRFWELDSVNHSFSMTSEERVCEEHFLANTYRNDDGRFVVLMPFKQDPKELGNSNIMAKTRFLSLERRFNRDPVFKNRYLDFMHEYEDLRHMSENKPPSKTKSSHFTRI
ncbi:unnamed protein product [Euphydryas editha]|uniref:Peptidase aspartic putative domain-containing protein n=1 Tax=Euphydryas editha TaxID=104508 RepID=A0AAU9UT65_EUPED|nr:unnamed protein product [Euphydryas editha]